MARNIQKIVLIDGNALIHRAFHALPLLTSPKGEPINACYGFTTTLFKVLSEIKPNYIVCTFDYPSSTFRHKEYKAYKAHREKAPQVLYDQIPKVKKIVKVLDIPFFEQKGFEADDLIASLVEKIKKNKNLEIIIVTGDLDELQLVNEKTKVYTMKRGFSDTILYDSQKILEKFGIKPDQLVDYKALRGDPSDNIPGVKGIGEKTAAMLIKQYGTLENLYQNLNMVPEKIKILLQKSKKEAFLSKKLSILVNNLPLKFNLEKCRTHTYKEDKVIKLFKEFGFESLINRLFKKQEKKITNKSLNKNEKQLDIFENSKKDLNKINALQIDHTLEPILGKMQEKGILIDVSFLKNLNQKASLELKKLEKKIYKNVGHKFNINSPNQLSVVLFEELHLPTVKKTKTGYSTDAEVLKELITIHPIIKLILSYREFFKLKSTYLDALPNLVDKNNRIHTTYTQDTATGRLASRNPNLQNIPVSDGFGQKIRQAFIAPERFQLLGADYSQIELRIIASLSGDQKMIEAFKNNEDIHAQTAAEIFNISIEKVDNKMRRIAKTVNFGIIYGMGAHGLARRLGISYEEAENYIQEYFIHHPGILNYIEKIKKEAHEKGYVKTLFNRKRYLPEIKSNYSRFQKTAERMAINMPIQGTAADLIKLAMIQIDKGLSEISPLSSMLLQVHDELIFEVFKSDIEKVRDFVKDKMENIYQLKVPIKVEISVGNNWGELK